MKSDAPRLRDTGVGTIVGGVGRGEGCVCVDTRETGGGVPSMSHRHHNPAVRLRSHVVSFERPPNVVFLVHLPSYFDVTSS